MIEIFVAKNSTTNQVTFFDTFEKLKQFSEEHKYECIYFSMPVHQNFMDSDLFLKDGDDPSDYL